MWLLNCWIIFIWLRITNVQKLNNWEIWIDRSVRRWRYNCCKKGAKVNIRIRISVKCQQLYVRNFIKSKLLCWNWKKKIFKKIVSMVKCSENFQQLNSKTINTLSIYHCNKTRYIPAVSSFTWTENFISYELIRGWKCQFIHGNESYRCRGSCASISGPRWSCWPKARVGPACFCRKTPCRRGRVHFAIEFKKQRRRRRQLLLEGEKQIAFHNQ